MLRVHIDHRLHSRSTLRTAVQAVLSSTQLCSVATVIRPPHPHIHTAYFSWDSLFRLYFLSNPRSLHGQHLQRRRRAALTVFDTHQPWHADHFGLQLFGVCSVAKRSNSAAARSYRRRFPDFSRWLSELTPKDRASLSSRFYVFTPYTLTLLDEARFGEETFVSATITRP